MGYVTRIVIIGGGPGGYEAALVAAQLGAEVTVVDCDGLGGASVLTDCVPSKTLIATAEVMTTFDSSYEELGIIVADDTPPLEEAARVVGVDLGKVNRRVKRLALAQSHDITASVTRAAPASCAAGAGWRACRAWTARARSSSGPLTAARRPSPPTPSSSPPAVIRANCPTRSPTASAS